MEVTITTVPYDGLYYRWRASTMIPFKSIEFAIHYNDPLFGAGASSPSITAYGRTKEQATARCEAKARIAVERDHKHRMRELEAMSKISRTKISL